MDLMKKANFKGYVFATHKFQADHVLFNNKRKIFKIVRKAVSKINKLFRLIRIYKACHI